MLWSAKASWPASRGGIGSMRPSEGVPPPAIPSHPSAERDPQPLAAERESDTTNAAVKQVRAREVFGTIG